MEDKAMLIKERPITLGQKTRELINTKITKIYNVVDYAQLWQWEIGAKKTLNPIPAILHTLNDIWNNKYCWTGGHWRQNDNPFKITDDPKISFLNKIYNSYLHVFKPLFNTRSIFWFYGDLSSHGCTTFKLWTLTYYRTHNCWDRDNTHRHSWKSKKSIFQKYWTEYNHVYNIGDSYACYDENVSYEEYNKSLEASYDKR